MPLICTCDCHVQDTNILRESEDCCHRVGLKYIRPNGSIDLSIISQFDAEVWKKERKFKREKAKA